MKSLTTLCAQLKYPPQFIQHLNTLASKPRHARGLAELQTFLSAESEYKRLMQEYWPYAATGQQEKVKLTARRVGLDLPKMTDENSSEDTKMNASSK